MIVFQSLDTNGSGHLTKEQLTEGVKKRMNVDKVYEKDLNQLLEQLDENGDGVVSYQKFVNHAS